MSRLPITFLVGCALSFAAASAVAAKPAASTFGTRVQLRECLALDDALRERNRGLDATTAAMNEKIMANQVETARLSEMKKTLDRSDKAAIAAFNKLAMEHNQHTKQVDDDVASADATRASVATDKAQMDQKCGAFTYHPADLDAVDKERKKAAALAAAASAASAP